MDKLDHPRVWLLAIFCVAAKDAIPDGVKWASTIGGWLRPPQTVGEVEIMTFNYTRPLYSALRGSRIKVSHDVGINRVMTGLKLAVDPYSIFRLQDSETACIHEMLRFIQPTLDEMKTYAKENVNMLMEAVLKEEKAEAA
jgi:hypothetical protein